MSAKSGGRSVGAADRFRPSRADLVDVGFSMVGCLIGIIGWRTSFSGGEELSVGVPAVLVGVALGYFLGKLALPLLPSVAVGLAGYVVLGGAVALRDDALVGFLPSPDAVSGLIDGSINGWVRLLTTLPPAGHAGNLLAIPYLSGFLAGTLTVVLAVRISRWPACALPPIALLVLTVLFGTSRPAALLLQGGVLAVVLIAWLAVRDARRRPVTVHGASTPQRIVPAVAMLAVVMVGGVIVGARLPWVHDDERYILREEVVPPFDPRDYPSPLAGFRKFKGEDAPDDVLFEVVGLPPDGVVRLAVMDEYDGLVWRVTGSGSPASGSFERAGEQIPNPAHGEAASLRFTIRALDEVWLPVAGVPQRLEFSRSSDDDVVDAYRFNRTTESAASPSFASDGDEYEVETIFEAPPRARDLENTSLDPEVPIPDVAEIDPVIIAAAADAVGDAVTPFDQAQALEAHFREGAYSDGGQEASPRVPPGHSLARVLAFLGGRQLVGNGEQYAATMALMLQARGIPARVVLGFAPDDPDGGSASVVGDDLHAWVEVPFQDAGWVSFDPTPDEDQLPEPETQQQREEERVETQPPPPTTLVPPAALPEPPKEDNEDDEPATEDAGGIPIGAILKVIAAVTLPLLLLLGPPLAVVFWKARRRKRRRTDGPPATRISEGWRETVDLMRDAGQPVVPRSTRREVARSSPVALVGSVAERADTAIFSSGDPTDETAQSLWAEVDGVRQEILEPMKRSERIRTMVSITSIRARS